MLLKDPPRLGTNPLRRPSPLVCHGQASSAPGAPRALRSHAGRAGGCEGDGSSQARDPLLPPLMLDLQKGRRKLFFIELITFINNKLTYNVRFGVERSHRRRFAEYKNYIKINRL